MIEPRHHIGDWYGSAERTTNGQPEVDRYSSAGRVYFTSLWPL